MPIVSHVDKENAGSGEGAPEKKKYGGGISQSRVLPAAKAIL